MDPREGHPARAVAGNLAHGLYDHLVLRPGVDYAPSDSRRTGRQLELYRDLTGPLKAGGAPFTLERKNEADWPFRFNDAKPHGETTMRAYVSLSPLEADRSHEHFVEIMRRLHAAGLDVSAKGAAWRGTKTRLDPIVIYYPAASQKHVRDVLVRYLTEKPGAAQESLFPAHPGSAPGLYWAAQPSGDEKRVLDALNGANEPLSHTQGVALAVIGPYLKRVETAWRNTAGKQGLAAHKRDEALAQAERFAAERRRVERNLGA